MSRCCLVGRERLAEFVGTNGRAHSGNRLFWGGLKEFSDGSLGSGTALMHEPYTNQPSTSGIRTIDYGLLEDKIGKADAAGLQVISLAHCGSRSSLLLFIDMTIMQMRFMHGRFVFDVSTMCRSVPSENLATYVGGGACHWRSSRG